MVHQRLRHGHGHQVINLAPLVLPLKLVIHFASALVVPTLSITLGFGSVSQLVVAVCKVAIIFSRTGATLLEVPAQTRFVVMGFAMEVGSRLLIFVLALSARVYLSNIFLHPCTLVG